ncbi:hypothetical protein Aph01nite_33390 [Acrocarpospora phusangensis]|uniref:Major facilitator superfamily (MFS) profile domain-containing protein n=1 Tax=Acrocarpospora phusangensis TaxID=1070424 RepID=A0A919QC73_9ACTN|nr:hypothetical protein Aph01nite_33390 [Acrocarpospora phusangensis]
MTGTRTLGVCYPLLAFTLTDSATWSGWAVFALTFPGLLCYLPAGTLADRFGHREVMIWSEALRCALVVVVTVAMVTGQLGIGLLLAIAFLEGGLSVVSGIAETALLPLVTSDEELNKALALHETTIHGVVLAGRPFGGFLYSAMSAVPFLISIATFALSASAIFSVRETGPRPAPPRRKILDEIRAGLVITWDDGFLRSAMLLTALTNIAFHALVVIFIAEGDALGLHPVLFGLILAASGIGGTIGAFISPSRLTIVQRITLLTAPYERIARFTSRIGLTGRGRSMMLVHLWICACALALTPVFALSPYGFALAMLFIGLAGGLSNVTIRTVFAQVPAQDTGKVVSVFRLGSFGAAGFGSLLGSVLFENFTPAQSVWTLIAMVGITTLAATFINPLRRHLSPAWAHATPRRNHRHRVAGGADAEDAFEVAGQMRLVVEAGLYGHDARGQALEQQATSAVHAAGGQVLVGSHREFAAERADEVRRMPAQQLSGLVESEAFADAGVEEVAKPVGEAGVGAGVGVCAGEVVEEAVADEGQGGLGFEFVAGGGQGVVQVVDAAAQGGVDDGGVVDGGADQVVGQLGSVQVEDAFAEAVAVGGAAVVRDVRREQGHEFGEGAVFVAVEVVADRA